MRQTAVRPYSQQPTWRARHAKLGIDLANVGQAIGHERAANAAAKAGG